MIAKPEDFKSRDARVQVNGHDVSFSVHDVVFKKSEEEKRQSQLEYRERYQHYPHVQVKNYLKSLDPIIQAQKKEYSDREDVKERKKLLAKRSRAFNRLVKKEFPDIYEVKMKELNHELHLDSSDEMEEEVA